MEKDYDKMLKKDLIVALKAADEHAQKQSVLVKKTNESKEVLVKENNELKEENKQMNVLKTRCASHEQQIKTLQVQLKTQKPVPQETDARIVALKSENERQSTVIKKLISHIDSFTLASEDVINGMRSMVNLSSNAFKGIIDEVQKK